MAAVPDRQPDNSGFRALWPAAWLFLFQANFMRILRGWRWKILLIVTIAGCYWGMRQPGFGAGRVVWFPIAWTGIEWLPVFLAVAAAVLGVEALGQWQRRRAQVLLQTRMLSPLTFATANMAAVVATCLLPALMAVFWAPIGAYAYGFLVLPTPNVIYLATVLLPVLATAASVGFFCRALLRSDLAALGLAAILLTPLLVFRLRSAPAVELFAFASVSQRILIQPKTMLREAAQTFAFGLPFLAAAALLLPAPQPRSLMPRLGWKRQLTAPNLVAHLRRVPLLARQWRSLEHGAALVLLVATVPVVVSVLRALPERQQQLAWDGLRPPADAFPGPVPALEILRRDLDLSAGEAGPLVVGLTVTAPANVAECPLGAFAFGRSLETSSVTSRTAGWTASVVPDSLPPQSLSTLIRFDPALKPGERVTVEFTVVPRPHSRRSWEKAWHHRFHSFAHLGPWYGESAAVDFDSFDIVTFQQPAPFRVIAPTGDGLGWTAGALEATPQNGHLVLDQPLRALPYRLLAGDFVRVTTKDPVLSAYEFRVQPARRELATAFYTIYERPLRAMRELFGPPSQPLVLYEVPEDTPSDPLAMSSAVLDGLQAMLPNYNSYEASTKPQFQAIWPSIQSGMVSEYVTSNFSSTDYPELLQSAFASYVNSILVAGGTDRRLLVTPLAVKPWGFNATALVPPRSKATWEQPLLPDLWPGTRTVTSAKRAINIHHMLRYLLGDDGYVRFVGGLMREQQGRHLDLATFQARAEREYGKPLDWFFDQWLVKGVLPHYEIEKAQAFLVEDKKTKALQYRSTMTIRNRGTGRMPVPWLLTTEGDPIEDVVWLEAGEVRELEQITVDRPIAFRLDPNDVIGQAVDPELTDPRQVVFKTITDL